MPQRFGFCGGFQWLITRSSKARRLFFFEKKNQKTFVTSAPGCRGAHGPIKKSFLLLFFKKEVLAS
jgi:hypothetical protein